MPKSWIPMILESLAYKWSPKSLISLNIVRVKIRPNDSSEIFSRVVRLPSDTRNLSKENTTSPMSLAVPSRTSDGIVLTMFFCYSSFTYSTSRVSNCALILACIIHAHLTIIGVFKYSSHVDYNIRPVRQDFETKALEFEAYNLYVLTRPAV